MTVTPTHTCPPATEPDDKPPLFMAHTGMAGHQAPGLQAPGPGGPAAAPRQPGWWARNWKWAVPVGAGSVFLAITGGMVLLVITIFSAISSTEVCEQAVSAANSHPAVTSALGQPIEAGILFTGNIEVSGRTGSADLALPISGPNGSGALYLVATKSRGTWRYSTLEVEVIETGRRIDLLAP